MAQNRNHMKLRLVMPGDREVPTVDIIGGRGTQAVQSPLSLPNGSEYMGHTDTVIATKKLTYPKCVFFIISNEFCERFSYYGMRAILVIYLQNILRYNDNTSTMLYHFFVTLCYFFPIFGAIIADSYIGKFKTIFYLSIVYAIGNIVLSVASMSHLTLPHREISLLGLLLIAVGTGGIKPCVSSFGGDQFVLPQQERQLQQFFSVFYLSINGGSLISTFLTPILRNDVQCFGEDSCFPLAFGVPAVIMVLSLSIFLLGKRYYTMKEPEGNIVVMVSKCIGHGFWQRMTSSESKEHWLDFSEDKYEKVLINDTKRLLQVVYILLPTILFWALFEQQGSRWTLQAEHMDGVLWGVTIKPDQMGVLNPVLVLILIPLFETAIYPLLAKFHLRTPLQKMSAGGTLAALAFLVSGFLQMQLEPSYAVLPTAGNAQLRVFNGLNCSVTVMINGSDHGTQGGAITVGKLDIMEQKHIKVTGSSSLNYNATFLKETCPQIDKDHLVEGTFHVTEAKAVSYFITLSLMGEPKIVLIGFDDLEKSINMKPKLRIICDLKKFGVMTLKSAEKEYKFDATNLINSTLATDTTKLMPARYEAILAGKVIASNLDLKAGGVYTFVSQENGIDMDSKLFALTPPNSVHILWQLPQIVIMTSAEIMFSITGLEFSYVESPTSMKSVVSSIWLLTDSFGNLLVVLFATIAGEHASDYFIYAGMMLCIMLVFIFMASRYKYSTTIITKKVEELEMCNGAFNSTE